MWIYIHQKVNGFVMLLVFLFSMVLQLISVHKEGVNFGVDHLYKSSVLIIQIAHKADGFLLTKFKV